MPRVMRTSHNLWLRTTGLKAPKAVAHPNLRDAGLTALWEGPHAADLFSPHQSPRSVTNVPAAAFLANSRFLTDCYRDVAALRSAECRKCDRHCKRPCRYFQSRHESSNQNGGCNNITTI